MSRQNEEEEKWNICQNVTNFVVFVLSKVLFLKTFKNGAGDKGEGRDFDIERCDLPLSQREVKAHLKNQICADPKSG